MSEIIIPDNKIIRPHPPKFDLLTANPVYKPFRYPWAYDAWLTQQRLHWLPEEVPLADDVKDWHRHLNDNERDLITQIFRFFTQADCYPHGTSILTPSGWKTFETLTDTDKVAQVYPDGKIEFVLPTAKICKPFKGNLLRFKAEKKAIDFTVTPSHGVYYEYKGKWIRERADDVKLFQNKRLRVAGYALGEKTYLTPFERLAIAFQADGNTKKDCDGSKIGGIKHYFGFSKLRKINRMRQILIDAQIDYEETQEERPSGVYTLFSVLLNERLDKNFDWVNLDTISSAWAKDFIEEVGEWDSHRDEWGWIQYSNTNKLASEKVQAVSLLCGRDATQRTYNDSRSDNFSDIHKVSIGNKDMLDSQHVVKSEVYYEGNVYCVTVPTGAILVCQNGKPIVSGNCEVNNCYMKHYSRVFKPTEVLMMLSAFSNIECFDDYTELLTSTGWKNCAELTMDDVVGQYDIETGKISFVKPKKVVHYPYKGNMHYYKDKTTDICITPNHDLILKHPSTGVVSKKKSMEGKWGRNYLYPTAGCSKNEETPEPLTRLLIALAADGCIIGNCPSADGKEWFTVTASFSKKRKVERFQEILDIIGIDYTTRDKKNLAGYKDGTLFSLNLKHYVDHEVLLKIKDLSFINLLDLDESKAKGILNEIIFWDGSKTKGMTSFYSSNINAINSVQAISVIAGVSATMGTSRKAGDECILPNGKRFVMSKNAYVITFSEKRVWRTYPNRQNVDYDGHVHCVSVPTQNIISRRNGKVAITGNTVHIAAYSYLLDTLGLPETDYSAFLKYKEMKDKYDYMQTFTVDNKHEIAKTLAAFGAFTEGLQLFASFAILLNFPRFNKLKGMGQIVTWSVRDETLHCLSIIKLFRTFVHENPEIWTPRLQSELKEICRTIVEHEEAFIDMAFAVSGGKTEGLTAQQVKTYIHFIADRRLIQLGLDPIYSVSSNPLPWLDDMLNAVEHTNFFENRATEYSRASTQGTWEEAFEGSVFLQR